MSEGTVIWVVAKDGKYTILDPIVKLKLEDGTEKRSHWHRHGRSVYRVQP